MRTTLRRRDPNATAPQGIRVVLGTRAVQAFASAALAAALLASPAVPASAAGSCSVAAEDFCVCCPPSDCHREEAFCPGGAGGLLILEARHPGCAVNPYDAKRCRSGGVIASEMSSALGVYRQGQRARVELSQQQLEDLVRQLEGLRP